MSAKASIGIPAETVLTMVRSLLEFPFPQICRHLVAAELLAALKENGHQVPVGLIEETYRAHDVEALALLEEAA